MSPAFRAIRGANLFRCEWVPYLSEYVCNIWLRSDGRVERKGGYRHTDSWHEWVQDNFYGRSAIKRIVIKEPSLNITRAETNECVSISCWKWTKQWILQIILWSCWLCLWDSDECIYYVKECTQQKIEYKKPVHFLYFSAAHPAKPDNCFIESTNV